MCGFCGAFALTGPLPPQVRMALPAMTRTLRHRGPDGEGFFDDGVAAIGHRRLSIIDREGGAQPMANEDGTVWVAFNGEIYNHRALRAQLAARGHRFRTVSDTETIVHAFEEYGPACVDRLDGMFAFVVYDQARRQLLLARDRIGKKPLFYGVLGGILHFASEMKAFEPSPLWTGEVDLESLDMYFSLGYFMAPRSAYRHVMKLLPAHRLHIRGGQMHVDRYWDVKEFDTDTRGETAIVEELENRLGMAVAARLESEVPLGAFLSGGIDSGLIVSYMADRLPTVVTTSVGFGDSRHNELAAAAMTARHCGTTHYDDVIEPNVDELLGTIGSAFDEPFADSSAVPTYYVSAMARKHVTVALSGDGGDEIFGGYGIRYIPHLLEDRLRPPTRWPGVHPILRGLAARWPRGQSVPRPLRLGTFLDNVSGTAAAAYYSDLCFLKPAETQALMGAPAIDSTEGNPLFEEVTAAYRRCPSPDPIQRAQYADLHVYLPNDVLVKVDRMSMLHGLEVRSPLLDHHLVELAFRIPRARKLRRLEPKRLLRVLARRRLPAALLDLPKHGFTAPIAEWVTRHAEGRIRETLLARNAVTRTLVDAALVDRWITDHVAGRRDRSYPLWALWMFEEWAEAVRARRAAVAANQIETRPAAAGMRWSAASSRSVVRTRHASQT